MSDLSVEILKEIRDEVRATRTELSRRIDATNERLDATNERLDVTNERLDVTNERLEGLARRQVETEIRLTTELVATVGAIQSLKDVVVEAIGFGKQVADHERRLIALEVKSG